VVSNVVRAALGENALQAQGDSTAAGIRQALGHDALPVVFDEAEGEDNRAAQNMQGVLSLMRQASSETGGQILKGGSDGGASRYTVRSAFCLSSIVPQLKQTADEARVTVLTLRKADKDDAGRSRFRDHIAPLALMLTEEFTLRLQARTLRHLPTLRHNAKVFATAIADHLGSQRLGDQYGPLIAGDYLLHSTKDVTSEAAIEWVRKQDWAETQSAVEMSDELKLLAHIMESMAEVDPDKGGIIRWSIAELVAAASGKPVRRDARVPDNVAAEALSRVGLRVENRTIFISNTHRGLNAILRDTPWSSGWGRVLGRIDNAVTNKPKRFGAVMSKAVGVPIEIAIDTES
jgi:putative DNA primase/helicase